MSKIICDICGTTYSDTEAECPICGCAKDVSVASLVGGLLDDDIAASDDIFAEFSTKTPARKEEDFLVDEDDYLDDEDDEDDYEDEDDEDDEDDDDDHKSNAGLVIALVLVVLALIALSAFILVKFFLPNVLGPEVTAPPAVETTEAPVETTELNIPCESLALTSGGEIVLETEGANWLINVMALPENTTDALVYASSDEAVVTVNEQGKLTAVGEGTAVITITCGQQEMKCTVTCDFTVETTAPSEPEETTVPVDGTVDPSEPAETTSPDGAEETTAPEETVPEESVAPTAPLKDIDLESAINYKSLNFNGPNQGAYNVKIKGLDNTEVKWSSEDESIATVNEKGHIFNHGKGTTYIVCQYGDQIVKIKITSKW